MIDPSIGSSVSFFNVPKVFFDRYQDGLLYPVSGKGRCELVALPLFAAAT